MNLQIIKKRGTYTMKAFRISPTTVTATFTRDELCEFGISPGSVTGREVHTLAGRAFTYLGEHPRRFSVKAYASDVSLLLFAEEAPNVFHIIC